jgi:polyferredoxin
VPWNHTAFDATNLPAVRPQRAGCAPAPGAEAQPVSKRGRWRALVLLLVHVAIALHVWHWLEHGETLSPLEPSEIGATLTEGLVNAGAILFVLATLSTLLLGRFFCGWACHVVALQDGCAWLLRRVGLAPKPVRSRLLAFVPLLAALWMFVLPSVLQALEGTLPTQWRLALVTEDFWERFPGPWIASFTFLAVGGLAVWLLGSKGFCTYGCPYGAVFGLADRVAPGRIRVTDACNGCGHCTAVCTSNVEVHREVLVHRRIVDPGCMKCLDCVSACPKDALYFAFGARPGAVAAPAPARATKRTRTSKPYDFTWPEEIVLALVFALATFALFRGLYGVVPFLLALTLGVAVAVATVLAWRLARQRDFTFQHAVLRVDGRLTRAGGVAVALLALVALFVAHSALVKHRDRRAVEGLRELRAGAASPELAGAVLADLDWLARYGLWHAPAIDLERGRLAIALGRAAEAETALVAAAARSREPWDAHFALLKAQLDRRATDPGAATRASATLARVLEREPSLDMARGLYGWARELERELGTPASIGAAARLAESAGDAAGAAARRAHLSREYAGDPATAALEAWYAAR